jgi:hypothetical protein
MPPAPRGVELPEDRSGSSFLHELLAHAVEKFPDELAAAGLPSDAKRFKDGFGQAVVRFEAARAASERRVDIALAIRRHAATRLRFVDERGSRPFAEAIAAAAEPVPTRTITTKGPGRLVPGVTWGGERRTGAALRAWLADWNSARFLTDDARRALERLLDRADADGGALSLRGHRFAVLGAAAELAPTPLLLAAGADVLWIDLRTPPDALLARDDLGGTLHVPEAPTNLLVDPMGVAATIRRFADGGPVHVGMYAYAGGESQEFRLTASMNGILRTLPPAAVRSMTVLISPTTPMVATAEDVAAADQRLREASAWKRAFAAAGLLRSPGVACRDTRVGDVVVPLQGASYQAAQYVGKVLSAETHAVYGVSLADPGAPLTVSANVAPITATSSLAHPLFQAGFLAAPVWGALVSEPITTRELNGLLTIADLTDPEAPGAAARAWPSPAERARALFREQVHGGVFAQPWAFEGEIRIAAVIGLAKKPSLLAGLFRRG